MLDYYDPSCGPAGTRRVAMVALICVPFYWNYVLGLATIMRRTGGVLTDGELGLAEIQLLPGWKSASLPETTASIQAADRLRRRFIVVLSESRDDFTSEMDLALFRQLAFDGLIASKRVLEIDGPMPRMVAGFEALQTGALVVLKDRWLMKYHHTAIAGDRAFHQVIAWATPSAFDRDVFDRLLGGFGERPGPKPIVRDGPVPNAASRYDVH